MADRFILINDHVRRNALAAVNSAPAGFTVAVAEPKRSNDQSAKFHAICTDIANSHVAVWAGKKRNADEWKVLLVSAHTKATAGEVEFVPGLEGEFVNIRESTSRMSVGRAASLITYAIAFCDTNGVVLKETTKHGFMHEAANDRRSA
jgi:hypothetical protein